MALYTLSSGATSQGQDVTQIVKLLTGGTAGGYVLVAGRIQAATNNATAASSIYGGLFNKPATGFAFPSQGSASFTPYAFPPVATLATFAVGDTVVDQAGCVWMCTALGSTNTWKTIGNAQSYIMDRMFTNYSVNTAMVVNLGEHVPIQIHDTHFTNPSGAVVPEVQPGPFSAFFCMTPGYYLTGGRLSALVDGGTLTSNGEMDMHFDQNVPGQSYGNLQRTTTGEHFQSSAQNSGGAWFQWPGGNVIDLAFHPQGDVWNVGMTLAAETGRTETSGVSQSATQRSFNVLMWAQESA